MRPLKTAHLRQDAYANRCLQAADVLDRLQRHWIALYSVESAMSREDTAGLRNAVDELDIDLLRYALSCLKNHLNEAAIRDCAQLIAERMLDTAPNQPSIKRWKEWLMAAPMWPVLAEENWGEAVGHAADIVLAALEQDDVALDEEARKKLLCDMVALRLRDLLPESLANELLPTASETPSGDGDV